MSYISYIYVVEHYRTMGFARRLITTAREVNERRKWTGIVGLDAIENTQSMYEKYGYKPAFGVACYQGTVSEDVARERFGTDIRPVSNY